MEQRYRVRLEELLDDAEVPPGQPPLPKEEPRDHRYRAPGEDRLEEPEAPPARRGGALPRLEPFLHPFVQPLISAEHRTNARHYVQGLLSDLPSKDTESIAY